MPLAHPNVLLCAYSVPDSSALDGFAPRSRAPHPAATPACAGTRPKGVRVEREVLGGFVSASQQVGVLAAIVASF